MLKPTTSTARSTNEAKPWYKRNKRLLLGFGIPLVLVALLFAIPRYLWHAIFGNPLGMQRVHMVSGNLIRQIEPKLTITANIVQTRGLTTEFIKMSVDDFESGETRMDLSGSKIHARLFPELFRGRVGLIANVKIGPDGGTIDTILRPSLANLMMALTNQNMTAPAELVTKNFPIPMLFKLFASNKTSNSSPILHTANLDGKVSINSQFDIKLGHITNGEATLQLHRVTYQNRVPAINVSFADSNTDIAIDGFGWHFKKSLVLKQLNGGMTVKIEKETSRAALSLTIEGPENIMALLVKVTNCPRHPGIFYEQRPNGWICS